MMPSIVLATAGYDHAIKFWEVSSGMCYRSIQYPDSAVNRLKIAPDKQLLAAAGNPHVRMFDIQSTHPNSVMSFDGHTSNVTEVGFHPDGRWMYTGSEDCTVKIWDMRAPGHQKEFRCNHPVNTVTLHANEGVLVTGDQGGNIRMWDLTADNCSRELVPENDTPIRSVSVASDGTLLVAANNNGTVFVWDLLRDGNSTVQPHPKQRVQAHKAYVLRCLLSPNNKLLATTSSDHTVKLWNVADMSLDRVLQGHQRWVWDAAFSSDSGYIITASSDQTARLWDVKGDTIRLYHGHHKAVVCAALSDTGAVPGDRAPSTA